MYHSFFSKAQELLDENKPFATAVVVRAEKPTSGKPGDKALITADGTMYGWIGGSCSQPTVIREALKALKEGKSRFIRLSPNPEALTPRDGLMDFALTCFSGGTLEIYIEPQYPQPRLLIVGNLPVAQALAALGKVMNYDVVVIDPDGDGSVPMDAAQVVNSLADIGYYIRPDTYAVVATHGSFDETALELVIKARPRYIGLVASRKRFESVLDYLKMQGVAEVDLTHVKAPAGLNIQAQQGDEIALSIMAEIVQFRRSAQDTADWSATEEVAVHIPAVHVPPEEVHVQSAVDEIRPGVALDPVCLMEVEIATAKFTYEYQGKMYYFCAPGCKTTFRKNPQPYLNAKPISEIDPVCGMTVRDAHHTSDYQGKTYYFCSEGCKTTFDQNPESYLNVKQES